MSILKFLIYLLLSIFNKKKRYIILTPNLLYLFIKKVIIYDKYYKSFFSQNIERYGDYITVQEIFFNNDYNLKKFNFLKDADESNSKTKLIIDCGANIGCSSLFFYKNHPNSFIISIEPEEKNFDLLKSNTKEIEKIRLINSAISSDEHFFDLKKSKDSRGHKVYDAKGQNQSQEKTLTINNILQEYPENKFDYFLVKIDIEGFEKKLFEKNTEWMDKFKVIIIELHDWMMPSNNVSLNFQKSILNSNRHKDIIISGENLILINY